MAIYNGSNSSNSYNGTSSADTIYGLGGDDSLYGSGGNDVIYGGMGNDTLYGGSGINWLDGGDGDDDLWSSGPGGTYLGGAGNDTLTGNSGAESLDGGLGHDSIYGSSGNDTLRGGDGNDTLAGGDGADSLDGGLGHDSMYASAGNDTLLGSAGRDTLYGGDGADSLDGGNDDDTLDGGYGSDTLSGGNGSDELWGEDDDDSLSGGAGNDSLYGGDGNDTLDGGVGRDELDGGAGDDTYRLSSYDSVIDDSDGDNTIIVSAALDNAKLPEGFEVIYESADTLRLPYFLDAIIYQGVKHSAMGTGVTLKYTFVSGEFTSAEKQVFADVLAAYAKVTNLKFELVAYGTSGAYVIDKTSSVSGGSSNYPDSSTPTMKINPNAADDYSLIMHEVGHFLGLKHPGNYDGDEVDGQEGPFLPEAEDHLRNTIMSYTDVFADETHVRPFDMAALQLLYGVNANSRAGNDVYTPVSVYSGARPDTHFIWDGAGLDTLALNTATAAATVDLRDGAWSWVGAKAASILANGQFFINPNTVIENLTGSAFADSVRGNESNNNLNGAAGNDALRGMQGHDTLIGGTGADKLDGGVGNDQLQGGSGADTLVGGAGNDLFDFNALGELGLGSAARDVITDFAVGADKIDVSTIDANAAVAGDQAFTFVSSFTTTAGQVRYAGGIVYLNTDSDTAAEYEIQLTGSAPASLTAASFVL